MNLITGGFLPDAPDVINVLCDEVLRLLSTSETDLYIDVHGHNGPPAVGVIYIKDEQVCTQATVRIDVWVYSHQVVIDDYGTPVRIECCDPDFFGILERQIDWVMMVFNKGRNSGT